jgi:hypothetical protein
MRDPTNIAVFASLRPQNIGKASVFVSLEPQIIIENYGVLFPGGSSNYKN